MSAPVGRCVRFLQVARASIPPWGFGWALNRFVGISASDERKAGERAGDKAPRLDPLLPAVRAVFGFLDWGQNSTLQGGLDPINRKIPVGQGFPAGTTRK